MHLRNLLPLLLFSIFAIPLVGQPVIEGDTWALVRGAAAAQSCWAKKQFMGCPETFHFPLLQYLPAWPGLAMGMSQETVGSMLAFLSTSAFFSMLGVMFMSLKRASLALAYLSVALMATSPFLEYARSSFGECLAAFLLVGFAAALLTSHKTSRMGWPALVCGFLACVSKEVAPPFIFILGLVCLYPQIRPKKVFVLAGLCFFGVLVNAAFNYFRFHSPSNLMLLNPLFRVSDWENYASSFFGIWLAPNAGVMFFWPTLLAAWIVLGAGARRTLESIPLLAVAGVLCVLTLGFASWFAPYGWVAWGPRLVLPWLPVTFFILFHKTRSGLEARLRGLGRHRTSALIGLGLFAASLPQYLVVFYPHIKTDIFQSTGTCPTQPVIEANASYYYRCLGETAWKGPSHLWGAWKIAPRFKPAILSIFYGLFLLFFVRRARNELVRSADSVPQPT